MEAGKEMESRENPSGQESEDFVRTLLLEHDSDQDVSKRSEDTIDGTEFISLSKPLTQPTIRLAKSVLVSQSQSNAMKPVSTWKATLTPCPPVTGTKETTESNSGGIKILSPVGPYSSSASSSSSTSSSRLPQHVKIIKGNETRQISLAQATEMGLMISSSSSPIKTTQIIKSPIKFSSTSSTGKVTPKTIVIGAPNSAGKQVIIQPGSDSQRIIRIPPQPPSSATNIIQLNNNSKIQYVKVALPPNNKPQLGSNESIKIALPPSSKSIQQRKILPARRVILPTTTTSSSSLSIGNTSSRYLPIAPLIEFKEQEETKVVLENPISNTSSSSSSVPSATALEVSAGVRLRKPCNCSKSQCLKLYCDCFANGEFCYNCNCFNCFNNLQHEEDRQRSIRSCLERNPNAFRPKIGRGGNNEGERVHHKGCNCKRSSCLKNYCECYEAKIPCTMACRCVSCKNVEEFSPLGGGGAIPPSMSAVQSENDSSNSANSNFVENFKNNNADEVTTFTDDSSGQQQIVLPPLRKDIKRSLKSRLTPFGSSSNEWAKSGKGSFNFVTSEVISATCQCLLTQAEEAEKGELPESKIEALILEEFGRCLKQIIDISKKNKP